MKLQTLLASAALALLSVVSTGAYSESEDSYDVSKYHNPKGHYGVFDAVADSLDDSDSLDDYDYDSYDSFDDEEDEFIAVGKSRKRSKRRRRSRGRHRRGRRGRYWRSRRRRSRRGQGDSCRRSRDCRGSQRCFFGRRSNRGICLRRFEAAEFFGVDNVSDVFEAEY